MSGREDDREARLDALLRALPDPGLPRTVKDRTLRRARRALEASRPRWLIWWDDAVEPALAAASVAVYVGWLGLTLLR